MQHVTVTRGVQASPAQVWALISDLTTVDRYHPMVKSVDLLSDEPSGLAASRRCNFHDGSDVREEVVAVEDGERIHISLSEFSMPMKQLEAEWRVASRSDGTTDVTFEISYLMKMGFVGKALGATAVRGKLRKMMSSVLSGLDRHLATGESIGPTFKAN